MENNRGKLGGMNGEKNRKDTKKEGMVKIQEGGWVEYKMKKKTYKSRKENTER